MPGEPLDTPPLPLTLGEVREQTGGRVTWSARDAGGTEYEVVEQLAARAPPAPPASLAEAVRLPVTEALRGERLLRIYPLPAGSTLAEILAEPPSIEAALRTVRALGRAVAALHAAGHGLLGLHAESVRVTEERALLLAEGPYPRFDDLQAVRAPTPGFSAPEAFGRGEGRICEATDVFLLGMLLYYLVSGAPKIPEAAETGVELPRPRAWRPDLPPGLEGVFRRATARLASRRTPTVARFLTELEDAQARLAARGALPYRPAAHVFAAETHLGIAKGRARPVNEDSHLARVAADRGKALFAVADGVSHATLGSGDRASRLATGALDERWQRLAAGRLLAGEIPPRVAENLLVSMARAANDAIVAEANALAASGPPQDAEVMATTLTVALLDGNRLHLCNLGDSRAYLCSGDETEALTCDHDVRHEALRERRPLANAQNAAGGSQLTRFAGHLEGAEGAYRPVDPRPDLAHVSLFPGDRLLLCSDGLSDYVGATEVEADEAIARVLAEHRDPARAAFELVVLANRAGGGDNVTCIVVDVS
jgi:protein phosphatase